MALLGAGTGRSGIAGGNGGPSLTLLLPGSSRRAPSCQGGTSEELCPQGERKAQEQQQRVWDSRTDLILPLCREGTGAFQVEKPWGRGVLGWGSYKAVCPPHLRGFNWTTPKGKDVNARAGQRQSPRGNRVRAVIRRCIFWGTFPLRRGSLRSPHLCCAQPGHLGHRGGEPAAA